MQFTLRACYTILFSLIVLSGARAQVQTQLYFTQHRPAGLDWQELKSPHFRIIFAKGDEDIARKSARLLESQYAGTFALTGGELSNFPVVLTPYNDLTNGFVSSLNFRSEVDLAPFKGKSLNPQSGLWLENVLPHELVHANHANVTNEFSIARFYGLFSPDFRRTFNMFPPLGVHEGLAVYHESERGLRPQSGRANYTYFTNLFNANLTGNRTWSLAQNLVISDYNLPNNRHYIGGSAFTAWLHQKYGDNVSKRLIEVHQNVFFLGYGYALKQVTGRWPGELYQLYIADQRQKENQRLEQFSIAETATSFIGSPFQGVRQNAPVWVSDTEILYYTRQYNSAPSFFLFDTQFKTHSKISEHFVVSDYYYDFDVENQQLVFAEFFAHNTIYRSYQSDLVALDIRTGKEHRLTSSARLYSPTLVNQSIIALQPDGDLAAIVQLSGDQIEVLKAFENRHPVALKASKNGSNQLAVLINQRGVQALWITDETNIAEDLDRAPDLAFRSGSIHDPQWHPTENKILFTLDAQPAMNVYEYDLDTGIVTQITNHPYNAFEAKYAPDGNSIAYVVQIQEEQKISILNRADFLNAPVKSTVFLSGNDLNSALTAPVMGDELTTESELWEIESYSSDFRWLKPRAILPVVKVKSGVNEWGAQITSTDVLQSQMYIVELTTLKNMLWYNATYTNKSFWPGFTFNSYREPDFSTINFPDQETALTLLTEERGLSVGFPFEYYFDAADRFSSFYIQPSFAFENLRFHSLDPTPVSTFTRQNKFKAFTQFNYRILQRARDVQPASGIQFFAQIERVLNESEMQLTAFDSDYRLELRKSNALFYGINTFLAPFRKTNQSLKLGLQFLNQSDNRLLSNHTIIPMGFSSNAFDRSSDLARFSSRYTIPVLYPDNGGLLIPFYVSTIYLSLFSHTLADLEQTYPLNSSTTVLGIGLHLRYKISNLALDIGVGITIDPTTGTTDYILGTF